MLCHGIADSAAGVGPICHGKESDGTALRWSDRSKNLFTAHRSNGARRYTPVRISPGTDSTAIVAARSFVTTLDGLGTERGEMFSRLSDVFLTTVFIEAAILIAEFTCRLAHNVLSHIF